MIVDPNIDPNVGKNFIEHFGTRGMKWGVRRTRAERAGGKKEEKDGDSKPKVVVGKTKTGGKAASEMSDAQLKRVNNRLNMEQQYAKMTDPGPSMTQRIMNSTSKFALQAGRQVAMTQVTNLANEKASQQVASMLAKRAAKVATTVA
jgi:hypothetical protein